MHLRCAVLHESVPTSSQNRSGFRYDTTTDGEAAFGISLPSLLERRKPAGMLPERGCRIRVHLV